MKRASVKQIFAATLLATGVAAAHAAGTIDTGLVQMGLFDNASLGYGGVGLNMPPVGDAITPGCLCEGWGAAINGVGNYASGMGDSGISGSSLVITDSSGADLAATSTVTLANGLQVIHNYSSAAGGTLFKVVVTLKNTTGATATDVRYARTLDWDVPPGHFSDDYTTIYGGTPSGPGGKVFHTSFNPFDVPDPMVTRGTYGGIAANTNGTNIPGDLGAYFILKFDDLAAAGNAGDSVSFETYIGASPTTAGLTAAFAAVGVEAYSYTFDNDGASTYGWGFAEVGLPPAFATPAPGPLALMAGGLLAGWLVRRRRTA